MEERNPKLLNPYLAGLLLGLVLLASYLILGAGLGASGGLARLAAWVESIFAPAHTAAGPYFGRYGQTPLAYYLVFMLAGIFLGGLFSSLRGGRFKAGTEKGASFPTGARLALASGGGLLVGFASRLARGCTSGQALSGGAQIATGSLIFVACLFATGYAVARLFRRQWHD